MSDLSDTDYGSVEDAYQRHREYEEAEHLLAQEHRRADTLLEHRPARPDPKPVKREPRRTGRTDQLWRWKLAVLERDQGCSVHTNPADCREGWQVHLLNDVPPQVVEYLCGLGFGAYLERRYL